MMKKYALVSVYNKDKLGYLCKNLSRKNFKFISTSTTSKKIKSLGFNCDDVSEITKFKPILDGRVKTLDQRIYGSILYKRDNEKHFEEFKKLKIPSISLVVVDLYPFEQLLNRSTDENILEMIDIGGISLLRASGKNYNDVTTISDIRDYEKLIKNLDKNIGKTDLNFRKRMASKAFKKTSEYDALISKWLKNDKKTIIKKKLRYGENPNQKSFIINDNQKSIFEFQINGKEISYNNIIDIDNGMKCLNEFNKPTCAIIKHNNPCGVASSKNIESAFTKAYQSDSKSAYGGIVLLNRKINKKLALILSKNFFEVIVAPSFYKEGREILSKKKKLILLEISNIKTKKIEFKSSMFGTIYQESDTEKLNKQILKLMSTKSASKKSIDDIIFGLKVVKHLKSNAIVIAKNEQTIGIGCGQTNRIDALKYALNKSRENLDTDRTVCVSDGFFPFTDSLKKLNNYGCNIIATPSGSVRDNENIKYADKNKMSLYFTKNRLFKH